MFLDAIKYTHVRALPIPLMNLLQPGDEDDLVVILMSLHDSQGNRRVMPYVRILYFVCSYASNTKNAVMGIRTRCSPLRTSAPLPEIIAGQALRFLRGNTKHRRLQPAQTSINSSLMVMGMVSCELYFS